MAGELLYLSNMTEAESNLEKYRAHVKATGYDKLRPLKNQPADDNELMKRLGDEGMKLLAEEATAASNPKTLDAALGATDPNPYVRARTQVLKDLPADKRARIELMERDKKTDNAVYDEFSRMVAKLGDKFSDEKKS
jgi:hypothetical protein